MDGEKGIGVNRINFDSKEVCMTDRKMMQELFKLAEKHKNFMSGDHNSLTKNVGMYVDKGSYGIYVGLDHNLDNVYFSFTMNGIEVTHQSRDQMQLEGLKTDFNKFNFSKWAKAIEEELEEETKTICVNGKKYKLVEDDDDIPF